MQVSISRRADKSAINNRSKCLEFVMFAYTHIDKQHKSDTIRIK